MRNKLLLCLALFPVVVLAETIEIKDPENAVEIYALLGAASICADSDNITLNQRFEMEQIEDHYNEIRRSNDLEPSYKMMQQASAEKKGIAARSDPSYRQCEKALKLNSE